jgi:hypothetical protein
VRNPLKSCASQAERERFIHRYKLPFRYYRGSNGRRYFTWRLTGDEPIYQHFDRGGLTLFQDFFIQWIEIENRAQRFLDRYAKRADCFLLHTPTDLNDAAKIGAMFDFLDMRLKQPQVVLRGERNHTPGSRRLADDPLAAEARQVVDRLPDEYLAIFRQPPYADFPWISLLHKERPEKMPANPGFPVDSSAPSSIIVGRPAGIPAAGRGLAD